MEGFWAFVPVRHKGGLPLYATAISVLEVAAYLEAVSGAAGSVLRLKLF